MKKILIVFILLTVIILPNPSYAATKVLEGAVTLDGRTMLPLRSIFESLGAEVQWNDTTKTIFANKDNKTVELTIQSRLAFINGKSIMLDVPPMIVDGKTLVPVRFVGEALDATVNWDGGKKEVTVLSGNILLNMKVGKSLPSQKEIPATTLYNAIYNGLVNLKDRVDVSKFTTNYNVAFKVLDQILEDHPEVYYFDHSKSLFWSNGIFELKYKFPKERINKTNKQLEEQANMILLTSIKSNMTEYEKVKAIHDYVVLHTSYDYNNYLKGTIPDSSYTIIGNVLNGVAVCDGYSKTMKYLLNKVGIESLYVIGKGLGEDHAWNKVKVNGKWYNMDATWNDPVPNIDGYVGYDYFLIPDSVLAIDHSWNAKDYPVATDTWEGY